MAGALTETFDTLPVGQYTTPILSTVGTFETSAVSPLRIQAADAYGGANGTRYAVFGAQSGTSAPVTLSLNSYYVYFGFWWSAGDASNGISFYSGDNFIARFSSADLTTLLSPTTGSVTAIGGRKYKNDLYYGNPNNGQNTAEPYAYVHFIANGVNFNKIVFDNSGSTQTGFEMDNMSLASQAVTAINSTVFVKSINTDVAFVPEPSTATLIGAGLVLLSFGLLARARSPR